MADIAAQPFVNYDASMQQANAEASTAAVNQQNAQRLAMENQITKASMPLVMDALRDYQGTGQSAAQGPAPGAEAPQTNNTGVSGDGGSEDPNTSWLNKAQIDAGLRNRFYVSPITEQEQQAFRRGAILSGRMPGIMELAKQQRDQRIQMQTSANQLQASNLFDAMRSVTTAPPGKALDILDSTLGGDSSTVAKIRKQLPSEADEDTAAREFARHVAGSAHMYTGRKAVEGKDGNYRDEQSGFVVPGTDRVGLSDEQWAAIADRGMKLVDVPDGAGGKTQEPQWKTQAQSLDQWVMMQAAAGGEHSASPTVGGAPKAAARKAATAAAANSQAAADKGGQPQVNYVGPDGKSDPAMSKALSDHDYDFTMPHAAVGQEPPPEVIEARKAAVTKAGALKQDASDATAAAAKMKSYLVAAQDVLDNGDPTGKWNGLLKEAGQWLPVPQSWQPNVVPSRQELAKYLGNAALANAKAIYGAKMTQSEVKLQLNELSPEAGMSDKAIRNMLQTNMRNADYTIATSRRVGAYLGNDVANPRRDPTRFADWNENHFPLSKAVNAPASAVEKPKFTDAQIDAYMKTHKDKLGGASREQVKTALGM